MKRLLRSTIIFSLLLSVLTSSYNQCMSGGSVGDVPILPAHINRIIEERVAQQVAATNARLEGQMAGYAQALGALKSSGGRRRSWIPSFGTICKAGIYLGVAGATVYAGYCAYKKWQWLRNLVDGVHEKVRGAAQRWLDIPWIKERLSNIVNRIEELAKQITGLQRGQEGMQRDLEKVGKDTQNIMEELQKGAARDEEIKTRLGNIEAKLDRVAQAVHAS